jgi:hypothetical protein
MRTPTAPHVAGAGASLHRRPVCRRRGLPRKLPRMAHRRERAAPPSFGQWKTVWLILLDEPRGPKSWSSQLQVRPGWHRIQHRIERQISGQLRIEDKNAHFRRASESQRRPPPLTIRSAASAPTLLPNRRATCAFTLLQKIARRQHGRMHCRAQTVAGCRCFPVKRSSVFPFHRGHYLT